MRLSLSKAAEKDSSNAMDWYETQRSGLGNIFLSRIERQLLLIESHPLQYPKFMARFRHAMVKGFPYRIIYQVHSDFAIVLAIAHTSRKPDYWL